MSAECAERTFLLTLCCPPVHCWCHAVHHEILLVVLGAMLSGKVQSLFHANTKPKSKLVGSLHLSNLRRENVRFVFGASL